MLQNGWDALTVYKDGWKLHDITHDIFDLKLSVTPSWHRLRLALGNVEEKNGQKGGGCEETHQYSPCSLML